MLISMLMLIHCRLLKYIGRGTAPSPATGNKATHKRELSEFMEKAMTV